MARKSDLKPPRFQPTYIKAWRKFRGYTQARFIERLDAALGHGQINDASLNVPRTTASLSRIENGEQPYNQATLEAFAVVLDTDPASLIGRDPTKEGQVISMIERLSPDDLRRATDVLTAMFRSGTDG